MSNQQKLLSLLNDNETLFEDARKELEFDMTNIDLVSMRVPGLSQKYGQLVVLAKAKVRKAEMERDTCYKERWEFYIADHNVRVDRRDIEIYIKGDEAYQAAVSKVEFWRLKVEYIEIILKALDKISWNLGNAIKIHMFRNGG